MNLKSLIHRELAEGLTEKEVASAVGVSVRTIADILADKAPKGRTVWETFAMYFRTDVDVLRTGLSTRPPTPVTLADDDLRSSTIEIRRVPLLSWSQMDRVGTNSEPFRAIRNDLMLEATDVRGRCTFALTVKDNSMHPVFSEGEIIFVDPDLKSTPGDYVVVGSQKGRSRTAVLRQVQKRGSQEILHPLSRRHGDRPLTKHERVYGKVVRLRKNL